MLLYLTAIIIIALSRKPNPMKGTALFSITEGRSRKETEIKIVKGLMIKLVAVHTVSTVWRKREDK